MPLEAESMSAIDFTRFFANADGDAIGNAFASRRAVLPWRDRRPLNEDDIAAIWPRLLSDGGSPHQRLAYIHVPFCANHCLFCAFYRNAYTAIEMTTYAGCVVTEIEREADEAGIRHHPIEAVYVGGGTPSALSADDLARILDTMRRRLPLAPDCEITLEGRIVHFDDDKIDACIAAGVNRISIGVQSFDTAVRRRQGRRASKDEAIRFLENIRDRNRVALVIDLLYGLPEQTLEVWREDLRIADALAPEGIDLYGLNLIPGTPLQRAAAAGKLQPATLQHLGTMYAAGAAFLDAKKGWRQISNSHWARTPRERNLYNLRIKQGAECLAYGSGAGGTIGRYNYRIAGDLGRYSEGIAAGRKPLDGMSASDDLAAARHYVTAGFEVGRLDLGGLDLPHIPDARALFAPLLEQWQRAGLVEFEGDAARLTLAGRFWYGNLVAAFNDIITCTGPPPTPSAGAAMAFQSPTERRRASMNETVALSVLDSVRQELAAKPDGVLEAVASTHGLPLQRVVECLPADWWKRISGEHFIDVMQDIAGWGDITFIVHTKDAIVEFEGRLPGGAPGHGFYNLKGGDGLSGHLRAANCRAIVFLRRPFMGMDTLSAQFFNADGEAMFKIFVGRDENRRLKADQVERFGMLEAKFAAAA